MNFESLTLSSVEITISQFLAFDLNNIFLIINIFFLILYCFWQ